jgi:hypothetical protein
METETKNKQLAKTLEEQAHQLEEMTQESAQIRQQRDAMTEERK